ncbi:MAG: polysaccharide deacetylase family protein [Rhodothermia bacterium]|nr:polysaccharide deacetylase family protein [Rhodothermia bacterium]
MTRVRIRLDVPDSLLNVSRWVIDALLYPLGFEAVWLDSGEHDADIHYGGNDADKSARVVFGFAANAAEVYSRRCAVDLTDVTWADWGGERWPVLFRSDRGEPDLVASAWYLLCGWQEMTTQARDDKGRFRYEDSLQSKLSIPLVPAVDGYREQVKQMLIDAGFQVRQRRWGDASWVVCPTVDVDYLKKWRPGMVYREVVQNLALGRRDDPLHGRLKRARQFASQFVRRGDLYRDSLRRIIEVIGASDGTATIFLKAGAHGPHDVAYPLDGGFVCRLVTSCREAGFEIGLHPSYFASQHPDYMRRERILLTDVVGETIRSVRQHYLRYSIPTTLRLHAESGFEIDSTLGFAEHEGFRRCTCVPYRLFDPYADKATGVWEMPLTVMDGTLFNRRHLGADGAVGATSQVMDLCERFGGCAVLLWHNVLWDEMDAPGWAQHFERTVTEARHRGVGISALGSALDAWRQSL